MTREQLIALCLQFRNVYEDYPFSKGQSAMVWTTIRHSDNKKIFALVFERDDKLYINLKCEPQYIEELRELKAAVSPGYHMNKSHWNTVMVNGDVSERELAKMIEHSYTLTSQCRLGRRRPGDGAVAAAGRDDNHAQCCRSAGNRDKRRKNLEFILQSERLRLRRFTWADVADLSEMLTDPRVMYAWEHTFSPQQIQDWVERQLAAYRCDGVGYFAAIAKDGERFVGQMGLHWSELEGRRILEVCYMLKAAYWHRGFALEGAKALLDYAFNAMNAAKVYACIRPANLASLKVAEAAGMRQEGEFFKLYNGRKMRHLLYSLGSDGRQQ